jgi:AraC-like DNA-binding protein
MLQDALVVMIGGIVGISILTLSLMLVAKPRVTCHIPLGILLIAIIVVVCPPLALSLAPSFYIPGLALSLFALMLLGPLLWIYVDALTSPSPWRISQAELLHFIPAIVSLVVVIGYLYSPLETLEATVLHHQPPDGFMLKFLAILTWLLLLFWAPQSFYYLLLCGKRLLGYRNQMKHVFANTEQRNMIWLVALIGALAVMWLLAVVGSLSSTIYNVSLIGLEVVTLMALVAVWILSLWGLNQQPAYLGHYQSEIALQKDTEIPQKKYSRSALDQESAARIADKIAGAIIRDKMYLNSDLTLTDLAEAIGVRSNQVSQVLNESMRESFFDYVNIQRIEAAKILLRQTEKTALEIAYEVGFNARSSFYKAFKRNTRSTPAEYRKSFVD